MSLAELAKREAQTERDAWTYEDVMAYVRDEIEWRKKRGRPTGYEVARVGNGWHIRWLDAVAPRVEG